MKAIVIEGRLAELCDRPRYVRLNESSGAWIEADESEAQAIAVGGELYNLQGSATVEGAPDALITDADLTAVLFRTRETAEANESAIAAVTDTTESALCEMDAAAGSLEERVIAIEDALCELDTANA